MKAAVEFIRSKGETNFISTCCSFLTIYGSDRLIPVLPVYFEVIMNRYMFENIRYLIVEHHVNFPNSALDDTIKIIRKYYDPVFCVEDPCATFYPLRAEAEYYTPSVCITNDVVDVTKWNRFVKSPSERDKYVCVYDLKQIFNNNSRYGIAGKLLFMEAMFYIRTGRYNEAKTALRKSQHHMDYDPTLKYQLAICYFRTERPDWGTKLLKELVEEGKLPPYEMKDAIWILEFNEAMELFTNKRFFESIVKLREILHENPNDYLAWYHLALCHLEIKNYAESVEICKSLVTNVNISDTTRERCREIIDMFDSEEKEKREKR